MAALSEAAEGECKLHSQMDLCCPQNGEIPRCRKDMGLQHSCFSWHGHFGWPRSAAALHNNPHKTHWPGSPATLAI